jgi:hypothetical protein
MKIIKRPRLREKMGKFGDEHDGNRSRSLLEQTIYGYQVRLSASLFLALTITSVAVYPPHLYWCRLRIHPSDFLLLLECRAEASISLVCTNRLCTYYYL